MGRELWMLSMYKGVSRNFQTGHLAQELQVGQLSATRSCCTTILW